MQRIYLIGYMGSGKTTIGKLLANRLGYDFIDMDDYIEAEQSKSVSQIFSELGEQAFRKLEQDCLHKLSSYKKTIIATGGGAPCFFDNMDYMNAHGLTVYLKLSPSELAARLELSEAGKRPLIADKKGEELLLFIAEGLKKRDTYYNRAQYFIRGEIEETVQKIYKIALTK